MEGDIVEKVGEFLSGCSGGEHESVVHSNLLLSEIDEKTAAIHNSIRDSYRSRFPELESLIDHPIDYARVVRKMGNEIDATLVDLDGLLPSAMIMVVSVAASTSRGKPLTEDALQETVRGCDAALALDSAKSKLVDFLGSRMSRIAPNLSAVVGSAVAAKLIATAGGLSALAQTPADYVQFFGARKGDNLVRALGFVEEAEIIVRTPPPLRRRAVRLVAGRLILAARMDSVGGDRSGETGMSFRAEIEKRIEKLQEAPPAKRAKPLPVPDCRPKKKRGGRRARKSKERYGVTEMRKLANRMQFGVAEESSLGGGYGRGYGMIGKLRVVGRKLKLHDGSAAAIGAASNLNLAFTAPQVDDPTRISRYF